MFCNFLTVPSLSFKHSTTHPVRWSSQTPSQYSDTVGNQIPACRLLWTGRCHGDPPSGLHTADCPAGNPPVGMVGWRDPPPWWRSRQTWNGTTPHSPDCDKGGGGIKSKTVGDYETDSGRHYIGCGFQVDTLKVVFRYVNFKRTTTVSDLFKLSLQPG